MLYVTTIKEIIFFFNLSVLMTLAIIYSWDKEFQ